MSLRRRRLNNPALLLLLLASALPGVVLAHAYAPILLEIHEQAGAVQFSWKESTAESGDPLATELLPRLLPGCNDAEPIQTHTEGIARISRWQVDCGAAGLAGQTLVVGGLDLSGRVVMVRYQSRDGQVANHLLRGSNDRLEFAALEPGGHSGLSVPAYLLLGVEHILTGYDHLLFVVCLMLLIGLRAKALLVTVTSFTLAHSLTLGLAALGVLRLPGPLVETLIAYSIVILAVEVACKGHTESIGRYWPVAFIFGLFHGLGFAGVLAEIGLPQDNLIPALLMFNLGVELGQVLFVLAVCVLAAALPRLLHMGDSALHKLRSPAGYAAGTAAACWFWARLLAF